MLKAAAQSPTSGAGGGRQRLLSGLRTRRQCTHSWRWRCLRAAARPPAWWPAAAPAAEWAARLHTQGSGRRRAGRGVSVPVGGQQSGSVQPPQPARPAILRAECRAASLWRPHSPLCAAHTTGLWARRRAAGRRGAAACTHTPVQSISDVYFDCKGDGASRWRDGGWLTCTKARVWESWTAIASVCDRGRVQGENVAGYRVGRSLPQ